MRNASVRVRAASRSTVFAMLLCGCLLLLLAAQFGRTQLVGDNVQYRPGARVETARTCNCACFDITVNLVMNVCGTKYERLRSVRSE